MRVRLNFDGAFNHRTRGFHFAQFRLWRARSEPAMGAKSARVGEIAIPRFLVRLVSGVERGQNLAFALHGFQGFIIAANFIESHADVVV